MFHAVSKILYVFSTPIFWIFALLLLAVLIKNNKRRKQLFLSSLVLFYFFSNAFIFDEIVSKWEPEMSDQQLTKRYELAVVLGGYSTYASKANQVNFSESVDRLNSVLPLYRSKKVSKILLAGGPGQLFDYEQPESVYVGRYLHSIGIKSKDVIIESASRNTFQNAVEAKRIIDSLKIEEPILLITSTTHMIRSSACFSKQGIQHDQYRVDGITGERKFYFDHLFIPNANVLVAWNAIIHEWLGLIIYKIVGYT